MPPKSSIEWIFTEKKMAMLGRRELGPAAPRFVPAPMLRAWKSRAPIYNLRAV